MTELHCLDCQSKGHKQVLARVTDTGSILIMRYRFGTTVINAPLLEVSCGCGYTVTVTPNAITPHSDKYLIRTLV